MKRQLIEWTVPAALIIAIMTADSQPAVAAVATVIFAVTAWLWLHTEHTTP